MSVVRKHQPGGSINKNDFQSFIDQKLANQKFTRKGESVAREVANNWVNLINSGGFDKAYSYNPTTQKYNINSQALPDELKSIDWGGSPEAIHGNILGRMSAKAQSAKTPKEKYNTLLANWANEYMSTKAPVSTANNKMEVERDFNKYFNQSLGGGEDTQNLWDEYKKDVLKNNPEAIKQDIINRYKQHLVDYQQRETNPETGVSYKPIENKEALLKAVNSNDWDALVKEEFKHGVNLNNYITPASNGEETSTTENADEEYKNQLRKMRFDENTINQLVAGKFKIDPNASVYGAENQPWLKDRLKSIGATVFTDPYGRQRVYKEGQLYAPIFNDPYGKNSEGYGSYIGYDKTGFAKYFTKGVEGYNPELFEDPVKGKDLRPIEGKVTDSEGNMLQGAQIQGFSPEGGDYTKHLYITKPDGTYVELLRDANGNYADSEGKMYNVDISSYGQYTPTDTTLPYFNIMGNKNIADFRNIPGINTEVPIDFSKLPPISDWTDWAKQYRNMFANLNYKLQNQKYLGQLNTTAETYGKLLEALKDLKPEDLQKILTQTAITPTTGKTNTAKQSVSPEWLQAGKARAGVFQSGGALKRITPQEYLTKYKSSNTSTEEPTTPKAKDIRGTLKDMSPEDYVSLAGAAASVLPGLGVIGGLTSTVADIEKDIRKDGFQWSDILNWNTAANLGFTALGAVGLGGLRALKLAGKASKIAKEADVAIKGVEDLSKLSNPIKEGLAKLVSGEAKTFAGAGIDKAALNELKALNIPEISKITSTTSVVPKSFVNKLTVPKIENPSILSQEFSGVINAAKKLPNLPKMSGNLSKGLRVASMVPLIPSALNTVTTAANEGIGNVDIRDLKNSLFLLSGARGILKQTQLKNLGKSLLQESNEVTPILRSGQSEIQLPKGTTLEMPKFKSEKIFKKANSEANSKILEDFKTKIKELTGTDVPADFDFKNAKFIMPTKTQFKSVNQSGLSPSEYLRAVKAAKGEINYWKPNWLTNYKEGGILKAQFGTKIPTSKTILPLDFSSKTPFGAQMPQMFFDNKVSAYKAPQNLNSTGTAAINTGSFKLPKLNIDENLLNTIGLGMTLKGNENIGRLQKRAAMADLVTLNAPGKMSLKAAPSTLPFYETQANKVISAGNRLGNTIADFDKRAGVMLSANKQAADLVEKGRMADQQNIQNVADKQAQLDLQDSMQRTEIANKNKLNASQVLKNVNLIDANKILANNTAIQNYMLQFNRNRLIGQQQQKYKDYFNLLNSPDYDALTKQYNQLSQEAAKSKQDWTDTQSKLPGNVTNTWEDTIGKQYTAKLQKIQDALNEYAKKVNTAGTTLQMPFMAKGGSLADKKELARYKEQLKLQSEGDKEVFKKILNNNQMMLKSLIKVFK